MHRIMNGARIWFDVEGAGLVQDGPVMQQRPTLVAEAFWTDPGNAAKVRTYIDECFPLYNPTPRPLDADRRSTFNPAMLHHFFREDGEGFRFDPRRVFLCLENGHDPLRHSGAHHPDDTASAARDGETVCRGEALAAKAR